MKGGKLWKIFDGRPENFDIINKKMLILVTKIGKCAPNLGAQLRVFYWGQYFQIRRVVGEEWGYYFRIRRVVG